MSWSMVMVHAACCVQRRRQAAGGSGNDLAGKFEVRKGGKVKVEISGKHSTDSHVKHMALILNSISKIWREHQR